MIPNKFRLFNKTWTIRPSTEYELKEEMGMCYVNNLEIAYAMTYPSDELEHVLAHEITHAIEQTLQLEMTERQVDLFALGLLDLIKNNPALIEYFKGDGNGK